LRQQKGQVYCASIQSKESQTWETLSFEGRQAVVDTLIKVISIADGNIEITWNI